jgi:hypothetical protein
VYLGYLASSCARQGHLLHKIGFIAVRCPGSESRVLFFSGVFDGYV